MIHGLKINCRCRASLILCGKAHNCAAQIGKLLRRLCFHPCPFVCWFVCEQDYRRTTEHVRMKPGGTMCCGSGKNQYMLGLDVEIFTDGTSTTWSLIVKSWKPISRQTFGFEACLNRIISSLLHIIYSNTETSDKNTRCLPAVLLAQ